MGEQRGKKTFVVSLDKKLIEELEKRAKRDYLNVQELINKILWRSARSSLRSKRIPRQGKASDLIKSFSRYRPYHDSDSSLYYCTKCKKNHQYKSKIGEKHLKYKK
jgi:hypothetical protein